MEMGAVDGVTLHQRLAAIELEIGRIKPTGQNEYKKPALSIGDVEDALRPLFAKHHVLTFWQRKALEKIGDRLWRAELICRLVNTDDPDDRLIGEWEDVGSNPSAAYSFVRKGFYKALFHLADDDEDAPREAAASPPAETKAKPPMTLAQQIAMVCRNANIDRSRLIKALTGQEHGRDLTREQAEEVLRTARAIERGDAALAPMMTPDGESWAVVVGDTKAPDGVA